MALGRRSPQQAEDAQLLTDPDEIARREAENGLRQFNLAIEIIATYVRDRERPFKLRAGPILQLHKAALDGLHRLAGTFRNTPVKIGGSLHQPPEAAFVSDEVQSMCEYVNDNWSTKSAVHLAAYVLWKMNWIHPFADGNGRTARAISYVVLSIKLDSLLPGTPTIPEQIAADKQLTTTLWKQRTANGPSRRSMCPNSKPPLRRCCLSNSSTPLSKHPAKVIE